MVSCVQAADRALTNIVVAGAELVRRRSQTRPLQPETGGEPKFMHPCDHAHVIERNKVSQMILEHPTHRLGHLSRSIQHVPM